MSQSHMLKGARQGITPCCKHMLDERESRLHLSSSQIAIVPCLPSDMLHSDMYVRSRDNCMYLICLQIMHNFQCDRNPART